MSDDDIRKLPALTREFMEADSQGEGQRSWSAPACTLSHFFFRLSAFSPAEMPERDVIVRVAEAAEVIRNPRVSCPPVRSLFPAMVSTLPRRTFRSSKSDLKPVEASRDRVDGVVGGSRAASVSSSEEENAKKLTLENETLRHRCAELENLVKQLREQQATSRTQIQLLIEANQTATERCMETEKEKAEVALELEEEKQRNEKLQNEVSSLSIDFFEHCETINQIVNLNRSSSSTT